MLISFEKNLFEVVSGALRFTPGQGKFFQKISDTKKTTGARYFTCNMWI